MANFGIVAGAVSGVGIFFGMEAFENWRVRTGRDMAEVCVLQSVAVWCSLVQSGAVCCRMLQSVAVCCSVSAMAEVRVSVCM